MVIRNYINYQTISKGRNEQQIRSFKEQTDNISQLLFTGEGFSFRIMLPFHQNYRNSWYAQIEQLSQLHTLPILLPSQQKTRQTLRRYGEGEYLRTCSYMKKILKKSPIFVWVADFPLNMCDIERLYEIGIEIFHAQNIPSLLDFIECNKSESIVVITDERNLQRVHPQVGKEVWKIILYCKFPELFEFRITMLKNTWYINNIVEVYNFVDDFESREQLRELPKAIFVNRKNTRKGAEWAERVFMKMMKKKINRKEALKNFIDLAKTLFRSEIDLEDIQQFQIEYPQIFDPDKEKEMKTVIRWYTKQSFAFRLLNSVMRATIDPYALAYAELLAQDLYRAVQHLSRRKENNEYEKVYRATMMSEAEIEMFKESIGDTILLNCFTSTTLKQEICQNFGNHTVLLKIIISRNNVQNHALISRYSDFFSEQEVLLLPYLKYTVLEVAGPEPLSAQSNLPHDCPSNFHPQNAITLSLQDQLQANSNDHDEWYNNILKMSSSEKFPILLPSKQTIKQTLNFDQGDPVRSISYIKKILLKYPIFVYVSSVRPRSEELELAYSMGIEFYHVKQTEDLLEFVLLKNTEDIIIVTDELNVEKVSLEFSNEGKIKRIYLFQKIKNFGHSFKFPRKTIIIDNIQEIFSEISNFEHRISNNKLRQVPKIATLIEDLESLLSREQALTHMLLSKTINRVLAKKRFAQLATEICPSQLQNIKLFQKKYPNSQIDPNKSSDLSHVIKWYTKESFVYKIVNAVLRSSHDIYVLAYVQIIAHDLFKAISYLDKNKRINNQTQLQVFRKAQLSEAEVYLFIKNIGKLVELRGFTSTTKKATVVEQYAGNTMMVIEADFCSMKKGSGFADISSYSEIKMEEQILFNPLNTFLVESVTKVTREELRMLYGMCSESELMPKQNPEYLIRLSNDGYPLSNKKRDELFEYSAKTQRNSKEKVSLAQPQKFLKLHFDQVSPVTEEYEKLLKRRHSKIILQQNQYSHLIEDIVKETDMNFPCLYPGKEYIIDTLYVPSDQESYLKARNIHFTLQKINNFYPIIIWIGPHAPRQYEIQFFYVSGLQVFHAMNEKIFESMISHMHPEKVAVVIDLNHVWAKDFYEKYWFQWDNMIQIFSYIRDEKKKNEEESVELICVSHYKEIKEYLKYRSSYYKKLWNSLTINFSRNREFHRRRRQNLSKITNYAAELRRESEKLFLKLFDEAKSDQSKPNINIDRKIALMLYPEMRKLAEKMIRRTTDIYILNYLSKAYGIFLNKEPSRQEQGGELDENYFFWEQVSEEEVAFLSKNVGKIIELNRFAKAERKDQNMKKSYSPARNLCEINVTINTRFSKGSSLLPFIQLDSSSILLNPLNFYTISRVTTPNSHASWVVIQIQYKKLTIQVHNITLMPDFHQIAYHQINSQSTPIHSYGLTVEQRLSRYTSFKQTSATSLDLASRKIGKVGLILLTHLELTQIQQIYLGNNQFSYSALKQIKKLSFPNLNHLELENNRIDSNGLKLICHACLKSLRTLDLDGNKISNQGIQDFWLTNNCFNLEEIRLGYNSLEQNSLYLIVIVGSKPKLEKMFIWGNSLLSQSRVRKKISQFYPQIKIL